MQDLLTKTWARLYCESTSTDGGLSSNRPITTCPHLPLLPHLTHKLVSSWWSTAAHRGVWFLRRADSGKAATGTQGCLQGICTPWWPRGPHSMGHDIANLSQLLHCTITGHCQCTSPQQGGIPPKAPRTPLQRAERCQHGARHPPVFVTQLSTSTSKELFKKTERWDYLATSGSYERC